MANYDNKKGFQVIYKEFDKIMREAKDKLLRNILEKDWIKIILIQIQIRKCWSVLNKSYRRNKRLYFLYNFYQEFMWDIKNL